MWPWIKRWRDWAMRDFGFMYRRTSRPQALHCSFEKAGLTLHDQPIPWNAEVVLVEALVRHGADMTRRKADFELVLPGQPPLQPEALRPQESEGRLRLFFRFPPPPHTIVADLIHLKSTRLGQVTIPVLSKDEFLQQLRLQMPTLFVRLGEQNVACQTFVSSQCRGLTASALLTSTTSLVPLMDLGLSVEFRSERGAVHVVPARLCSSQLSDRQALIVVAPRRFPRRIGTWTATWIVADRPLATQRVRAISQRAFLKSLRVSDTRFVVQNDKDEVHLTRQLPTLETVARAGPCFLVSSREPGMAGTCTMQVRAQMVGSEPQHELQEQHLLITDGPAMVAPGTLSAFDLGQVNTFELLLRNHLIGVLPMSPVPAATFTNEGGFKQPNEFTWSAAADEELNERLGKLLEGRGE